MWRLASTGPYSPPRRIHKDQSEQHGGGTSEKRKEREGHRGRREGRLKKAGRRRRRGNRMGKREEPRALAHAPVPGSGNVDYAHLSLTDIAYHHHRCLAVRVVLVLEPPPAQGKGEEPRPPACLEHLIPGWQTHCPARLVHLLSTEGTSSHSMHK